MTQYIAKRIRFRSGERMSVLQRVNGLPVHEATLFLDRLRTRGRAANTIHFVCSTLALVHRELDAAGINLLERLSNAQFLSRSELNRLATAAQYRTDDQPGNGEKNTKGAISIHRVHPKIKTTKQTHNLVDITTRAKRLAYIAGYLQFLSDYIKATLSRPKEKELSAATNAGMQAFCADIPTIRRRVKVGARMGLSIEEQARLLKVAHPDSPENPWQRGFVQQRNWLIVVLLLATGMRRGELLGLQIRDLDANSPKLMILRRPDKTEDPRRHEPNTKTAERIVELTPTIMRALWQHINIDRHAIKAARKYPQIIVSEDGKPLSHSSMDMIFRQLRQACPGLPVQLTSHVMRHTWNERFSEQADAMGLTSEEEQKARNEQQGWADNSQMGANYTRRHTAKKGRELTLRLQLNLDEKLA